MKKLIGFLGIAVVSLSACLVTPPSPGCPTTSCANECCPDSVHYGCSANGMCVLTSCDSGYQMCPGTNTCVPFPSECCGGYYCYQQQCGSNHTCMPPGSTDCGNGRYCIIGHFCINGGTACQ